jgi:N-dimethylarginine dimethylaminohydrolase
MWLDRDTVLIGRGLRTNTEGAAQVAGTLQQLGVRAFVVDLPHTAMHLMGSLRIADKTLAYVRSGGIPWAAVEALREHGYEIRLLPNEDENRNGMAHNFVTLGPRRILMPAGNPRSEKAYGQAGIDVITVDISEIVKAAGAVGCLSGILAREAA